MGTASSIESGTVVDPDGHTWMQGIKLEGMKKGMEEMMEQQPAAAAAADNRPSFEFSFEKHRLRHGHFRFAKVAQPDANEPIALLLPKIDPRSQHQRYCRQFLAR
jgi:hypothetical protein